MSFGPTHPLKGSFQISNQGPQSRPRDGPPIDSNSFWSADQRLVLPAAMGRALRFVAGLSLPGCPAAFARLIPSGLPGPSNAVPFGLVLVSVRIFNTQPQKERNWKVQVVVSLKHASGSMLPCCESDRIWYMAPNV